ncbi:MAG: geranylgeranylglycerol-phosphate geranylgeranyltransferase [Wenyingzhuangia sp.]|uniref:geranylgeranylglycerol-phosphate geranylgeranyltransferase n=1 Tax=Wenyingzhuangia sp. TaxID=1964193 RepID=UPI00321AD5C7
MFSLLKLMRWKNLVLICLSQIFMVLSIFSKDQFTFPVLIYIVCTFCFAASGNIINDIFDIIPDKTNKPQKVLIPKIISFKKAHQTYYLLNSIGLILTIYGSYLLQNYTFTAYGIFVIALLHIYSSTLKGTPMLGNLVIASFTSISLLFFLLIIPSSSDQNLTLLIYSLLAFLINWAREMIKDIEDIKGDKKANLKTTPITMGTRTTVHIIQGILLLTTTVLIVIMYLSVNTLLKCYIFITLILPLCYIFNRLHKCFERQHFSKISKILKLIVVFGILSIALIKIS